MDLDHPNLKYLGEALFLLGLAYKLARWAWRTKADVEGGDPDGFWSQLNPFSGLADLVDNLNQLFGRGQYSRSNITIVVNPTPPTLAGRSESTSAADSPPETLLDILTPEQRAQVLERLAKESTGSGGAKRP